jgi:hypothetical protein
MRHDLAAFSRKALPVALAAVLALGLAACDPQQKPPAQQQRFGENFEILPEKLADGGAPRAAPSLDMAVPEDVDLESRVKAALTSEPALRSVTVAINAVDGVITLNGTADSPANSERATRIVRDVDGVRSVRNELIVVRDS